MWRMSANHASEVNALLEICEVYRPNPEARRTAEENLRFYDQEILIGTREIIIEELAFLIEHSSLLMKGRATIRLLKKGGAAILEASNQSHDAKLRLLQPLRGVRWYLAMLVGLGGIFQVLTLPAAVGLGTFVIAVLDP
jgi:hypothetical protein